MAFDDKISIIIHEYESAAKRTSDDNKLLGHLRASYCRITDKDEKNREDITYKELYAWYADKYSAKVGQVKASRGSHSSRSVSAANTYLDFKTSKKADNNTKYGEYGFSMLFEISAFKKYLTPEEIDKKTEAFLSFVLHTCVAFLVSPEGIDELLLHYGFSQLHVRNIHHMAIYSVLKSAQSMSASELKAFDPLKEVEKLYAEARDIINAADSDNAIPDNAYTIDYSKTNQIHDYLIGGRLNSDNMLRYAEANKSLFSMRHTMMLKDCRRYSRLYTHVYDNYKIRADECNSGETEYSLYSFMLKYCLADSIPEPKRFNYIFLNEIEKNRKHPTREFMVIIWLYNYCFKSMNSLKISKAAVKKLKSSYSFDKSEADRIQSLFRAKRSEYCGEFPISDFIFGEEMDSSFDGDDAVSYINGKLSEYGLGALDARRKFDYYIKSLSHLKLRYSNMYKKDMIFWDADEIKFPHAAENLPNPLLMVFDYFDSIIKQTGNDYFPLQCTIYEQI